MELIKSAARRSKLSDVAYVVLNLGLAGAVFGLTVAFTPPYLAYLLIILSKWRVFAVRPRFWLANMQGNTIDTLVGISVVTLMWHSAGQLTVQMLITVLYAAWLLVIKPRSKRKDMIIQAEIGQFLGVTAVMGMAYYLDVGLIVAACWLVGYIAAWHALQSYDEDDARLLGMVWGIIVAECAWLGANWTSAYTLSGNLLVPQTAVIVSLIGYIVRRAYDYIYHGTLDWKRLRAPIIFTVAVIAIMFIRELSDIFA